MTTPLDRDLAERLERLAAAVPVRPGRLDPVHARAVNARHQLRMRWLTPLVGLVVLVLVAGAVGIGPLNVLNGPISSTAKQGDFELTIRSAKRTYMRGEPIVMSATLTYVGPDRSVRISHASSPMTFGIVEPVHGLLLNGMWAQSCGSTDLERGVGLDRPFAKSFGSYQPLEPEALAFVGEPKVVLPPGTWHPYVVAEFALGDCGLPNISMRTEIEIDVLDGPSWIDPSNPTALPSPTPVPEEVAIHMINLDPSPVEIVLRNKVVASLACGESTVISAWQLESAPIWNFIVRNDAGQTMGAATLDWHLPAGILIRDGEVLTGPWPMSYGPTGAGCDAQPDPTDPAPTPSPTPGMNGMQTSTDLDGDFAFVLTSDKQVYGPYEPIHIEAALTYRGSSETVLFSHDSVGPITFGLMEKVFGKIDLTPMSMLMCGTTTLHRFEPLISPFQKMGGFHNGEDAAELRAWMQDPVLRLPAGTWHVYARASGGPCLDSGPSPTFSVGGSLTIIVRDDTEPSGEPPGP